MHDINRFYQGVKLSDMERELLEYISKNTSEALKIGVRGVAQKAYSSPASVIRLSQKLGFAGFREMLYAFQSISDSHTAYMPAKIHKKMHFVNAVEDLELFFRILNQKGFVCLHGQGYSMLLAEYLEKKLLSSACTAIRQDYLEADTIIRNFGRRLDAMILISRSGNTPFVTYTAQHCRKAGIPMIAFTGNPLNELKGCCDQVFLIKDSHPFDIENTQSNYFFGYCILAFEEIFDIYNNRF